MSTLINDLPQYQNQIVSQQNEPRKGMDPNLVNELLNDINEAAMKGETSLPQRDIPIQTQMDEQATPNYVPEKGEEYVKEDNTNYIQNYNNKVTRDEKFDKIYDEIQTPLLLSILFFLFQLPVFKSIMFRVFPFLFSKDGNSNIKGQFSFSIFFGIFYYILNKLLSVVNF